MSDDRGGGKMLLIHFSDKKYFGPLLRPFSSYHYSKDRGVVRRLDFELLRLSVVCLFICMYVSIAEHYSINL